MMNEGIGNQKFSGVTQMTIRYGAFSLMLIACIFGSSLAKGQDCDRFRTSSISELISDLDQREGAKESPECIAFAIQKVSDEQNEDAIPLIAGLLDVRWPTDARGRESYQTRQLGMPSNYPAVNALRKFGKKSIPAILEVIKSNTASRLTIENAIAVYMDVQKDQAVSAVAMLKREADTSEDSSVRQRLNWAAFKAQQLWCSPDQRKQCKAVALVHYGNR